MFGATVFAAEVQTAKRAIEIALPVLERTYGAEQIARERPYHAKLRNGVWIVEGSLPKNATGGVAIVEVAKADGRVLRVTHGR
jgi:hypothetical protein